MSGPGVFVEFFEVLNQSSSQRIKVDVADQLQEVRILFTDNGFITVLEEMTTSFVAFVEGNGIAGHEAAHNLAEWRSASPEQKVETVCEAQNYVKLSSHPL